jgi:hypothetical protein
VQPHFGTGLKRRTEALAAFSCRSGKTLETTMLWRKEGNNAVGFTVIGMMEDEACGFISQSTHFVKCSAF